MATPSAIDNLKTKPKDEKTAVAGGVASLVVILLLVGWVIYFFNKIRSGAQEVNLDGISNQLRRGKYPPDEHARKAAAVLRAVADDLDI